MPRHRRSGIVVLLVTVVLSLVIVSLPATEVTAKNPSARGFSPLDMDQAVDPAVDFYRFANGGWLDRTTIPADISGITLFSTLQKQARDRLLVLLRDRGATGEVQPGSDEWKAIQLFEQGTDLASRNARGIDPVRPVLDQIDAIDDLSELHVFLETATFQNVTGLFLVTAGPDRFDSATTIAYLEPAGTGLPSYDEETIGQPVIDAYVAMMADLLVYTGRDAAEAEAAARAVAEFEAFLRIFRLRLDEKQGNPAATYNPRTVEELSAEYPMMDWPGYFAALGLDDVEQVVVTEPRSLFALDLIVSTTPLPVIKDYLRLQLMRASSGLLTEEIEATTFAFYGPVLTGVEQQESIELRSLARVESYLGETLGKLYVEAYFSPEAKAQSTQLTREIIAAFRVRLEHNSWMTEQTRGRALAKLDSLRIKVGYPEAWQDYSAVPIAESYYESVISASNAIYRRDLAQVGAPVDRDAWEIPPQQVTAIYNRVKHEITIPAGILEAPFFDGQADPAANFGAIGMVIGHEVTHAFDLDGSQFDMQGNVADWWEPEDDERFQALNDAVAAQYSAIEALPGHFVDGQLTVTENVADLGAIQVAYDALQQHLIRNGRPIAAATGLTQEQRFFVAAASVLREEMREETQVLLLKGDPHAPGAVRSTQPLRNCDAFHAAFQIAPGDPMYLAPDDRIEIW